MVTSLEAKLFLQDRNLHQMMRHITSTMRMQGT